MYEALAIRDIQDAADILFPVYEKTNARDGYVSLEVAPDLAYDTAGTVSEARRLFQRVGRKNLMIKVPGTKEGVSAIEQLTYEGININVTLLFSVPQYEEVALAYIAGLQKRADAGYDISTIASVASFFVSRVDTAVDALLEARINASQDPQEKALLQSLPGKAAIANAKVAYQKFREIFNSERFSALKEKGARVQRVLWGSTSTKNPHYRDVLYIEELIGAETINTIPPATLTAFKDHGKLRAALEEDLEGAYEVLRKLAEVGIDMGEVTQKLQEEGVKAFADSFDKLMHEIALKREGLLGKIPGR